MRKLLQAYLNIFRGLSREIWFLCAVTFVNRAGTMVIPFLALYLTESLDYTYAQVGWVMTSFGLGSFIGVWLGGKLTDHIGYYTVMVFSLAATGLALVFLQWITGFWAFCGFVFILMVVADTFRPAGLVAIAAYSKPANRTRSITLNRLAVNLGFSLGPALGGWIIISQGYSFLFWVDGVTCLIGALMIIGLLHPKKVKLPHPETSSEITTALTPMKDPPYLLFILISFLMGFAFMQFFSTLPLFYQERLGLEENAIGMLLALNGIIIVAMEMPLVQYFEQSGLRKLKVIQIACGMLAASYLALLTGEWMIGILTCIVLMTLGEMLGFPFTNAFAINRAPKARSGEYLALYSMSFSAAHMIGPNVGMQVADTFGFNAVWCVMGGACLLAVVLCHRLMKWLPNGPAIQQQSTNEELRPPDPVL